MYAIPIAPARLVLVLIAIVSSASACRPAHAQQDPLAGRWSVALELGELPMGGSFKAGISVGYHVSQHAWLGVVYQLADSIRRNGSSFNAQSAGLDGLLGSAERVGQRAYLQARVRPHRRSPYVSLGLVFNDRDTERMRFDGRTRDVGGAGHSGPLVATVSRPPGLRPALGLGWAGTSPRGVTAFVEWAGWWMFGAPEPEVEIGATDLDPAFAEVVQGRIRDHFTGSPFNSYHIFQIGLGYTP